MKKMRRLLSFVLSLVVVSGCFVTPTFANSDFAEETAAESVYYQEAEIVSEDTHAAEEMTADAASYADVDISADTATEISTNTAAEISADAGISIVENTAEEVTVSEDKDINTGADAGISEIVYTENTEVETAEAIQESFVVTAENTEDHRQELETEYAKIRLSTPGTDAETIYTLKKAELNDEHLRAFEVEDQTILEAYFFEPSPENKEDNRVELILKDIEKAYIYIIDHSGEIIKYVGEICRSENGSFETAEDGSGIEKKAKFDLAKIVDRYGCIRQPGGFAITKIKEAAAEQQTTESNVFFTEIQIVESKETVTEQQTSERKETVTEQQTIESTDGTVAVTGELPADTNVTVNAAGTDSDEALLAYDISLTDSEGEKIQAQEDWGLVTVSVTDDSFMGIAEDEEKEINIYQQTKEDTWEVISDYTLEDNTLTFSAPASSVYAITETILTKTIDASDGNTYSIKATYEASAGIPMTGTELSVSEMDVLDEVYVQYLNETAKALGVSAGELGYLRMFDISIVGEDGTEYQPDDRVRITVELMDRSESSDMRVVHFGEETEELAAATEGDTVTFTTESFSIFSFVDLTTIQNVVDAVFGSTYINKAYENDDIVISGRMPRTAIVEANPVEVKIDGMDVLVAYDIKIYAGPITRALGIAWQPTDGALTVRMKSDALEGREDVTVYHYADGSALPEEVAEAEVNENNVEFQAESFSVYALGGQHLRTYRFFSCDNADNMNYVEYMLYTDEGSTTFTQIIKDGEGVVVPQLPAMTGEGSSHTFAGWYAGTGVTESNGVYTYTALAAEPYDFNNIPAVTETETVYLFAKFADYAYVVFHDQWNGSSNNGQGSFPVAMTCRGELAGSPARTEIRISDVTVAYDDSSDENTATQMAFYGWSYTPIKTAGADIDENGDPVSRIETDTIELPNAYSNPATKAVDLYPIFVPVHWLNYYSGPTGSGATYIPSSFHYLGEGTTSVPVPVRSGYTFRGWYTGSVEIVKDNEGNIISENVTYGTKIANADGSLVSNASDSTYGVEISNGTLLLTKDATLFARWEDAAVNYTVVIWRQKVTDAANLANSAKTYDYAESFVLTGITGAAVSVANTYKGYGGSGDYVGFNYNRCDESKIVKGDGSTVLNVYYDRNVHTFVFTYRTSTAASDVTYYLETTGPNGNYGYWNNAYRQLYYRNGAWRQTNSDAGAVYSGTRYSAIKVTGNKRYNPNNGDNRSTEIHRISALYGANIENIWSFTGTNGVTYPLSNGSWMPYGSSTYTDRLTRIQYMPDEDIVFRAYTSSNDSRVFYYYVEALPGAGNTRTFNGRQYSLYSTLENDFNFVMYSIDFWEFEGFTRDRIAVENGTDVTNTIKKAGSNGVSWNDHKDWNGKLYFYYDRNDYTIEFYDSNTHQLAYVNGSQLSPIDVKYEAAISNNVPSTPEPKQLVTDAQGNIIVQDRPGCYFNGWYTDESCSTRIFFQEPSQDEIDALGDKHYVVWDKMPAHNLRAYAGWKQIDYLIQLDPNGGEMKDNGSTWFWEPYNGDPIEEYTWVTRNFVESADGTYYYAEYDRDFYGYDHMEWQPGEAKERHVYYTEDPGDPAADLSKTYKQSPNAYRYAGWYEVQFDENGNEIGETLYNFGEPVTHHTYLRLHWKKIGTYYVSYQTSGVVDGVTVTGTIDSEDTNQTLFVELDGDDYADNAEVVVTRTMNAPEGYNFIGWKVRNDASEKVYLPGESFTMLARYTVTVDGKEIIYLDPVFTRVSTARIIYDANGGSIADTEEAPLDLGTPAEGNALVPATSIDTEAGTAEIRNLVNNTEIRLSSGRGFSLTGEGWEAELVGWNTKPDASGEHFDLDTNYYVDTEEPVTLYAEWQVKVYFHRNKQESRWGSADNWAEYTALGEDVYYTTVYVNSIVGAPADIPVSTADPTDNLYFRYWGTQRYGDTSVIESYDFSAPVTGELHLYAFWDGPIELPVHVLDSSYENIEQVDSWRKVEMINVHPGDDFTFSESVIAADYVNVPDGYAYAFTAIHNRTDNVQNITKDEEIIRVYYDHKENVLYVQYADSNKADAPLADTDEVYFVYYKAESLPIGYKLVNNDGSFAERHADTATGALGEFSMAGSITAPLTMGGYSNNGTTYYAYALGTAGAANVSGMQIITSAANNQNSGRPALQIRNTWRGYEYSLDGANWTGCGYGDLKLYVLYFESQPTIVTLNEKTIGTAEDMTKKFRYSVTVTETVTTYTRTDRFNKKSGNYTLAETGTPHQIGSYTSTPIDLPDVRLADGEQQSYTLFCVQSPSQAEGDYYSEWSYFSTRYYRDYIYTVTTQTITIVQSPEDEFVTRITEVSDGTASQNERRWVYAASESSDDQTVTYTNTHTPLEVEVHLGIVGADGTITLCDDSRKAPADPDDPYYVLSLDLGGDEKIFLREIPSADLYEAEGYGFAGVYYGTHEGTVITAEGQVSSVTYGKVGMPNIHELYFDGNTSNRKSSYHVYYLYYPMPKMVYVKETSGGALTRISGSLDGTTVTDTITYNGASMELNGVTVEQEQMLSVTEDTFAINQGAGFRVLPRLDDGTEKLFLLYTKIGVSGNGSADNTNDLISGSVTDSKAMYLKVDGAQIKWSLNGMTWNAFDGADPTVYVIYKEIGYDLEITKVVDGASAGDTRTFTLTISSDAITESSYAVTGTGYNTVSATPATASAPGTIVLTIRHGSDITVKGLSRGEYTLTESGGAVMSAKIGDEEQTVTDNSMTIADLHENTKVDITNKMPPIAPTGFDFDCTPFVMLLGIGAALALVFKYGRKRRE